MNSVWAFCSKNFAAEKWSDGKVAAKKERVKLTLPKDTAGNLLSYPNFLRNLISDSENTNFFNFRIYDLITVLFLLHQWVKKRRVVLYFFDPKQLLRGSYIWWCNYTKWSSIKQFLMLFILLYSDLSAVKGRSRI